MDTLDKKGFESLPTLEEPKKNFAYYLNKLLRKKTVPEGPNNLLPTEVINKYGPRYEKNEQLKEQFTELMLFWKTQFRGDDPIIWRAAEEITRLESRRNSTYLNLMSSILVEAASFGFPSVIEAFSPAFRDDVKEWSNIDLFDPIGLLLLRIYIAELVLEGGKIKQQFLGDKVRNAHTGIAESIPAIFGQYLDMKKGPAAVERLVKLDSSSSYSRKTSGDSFIPDMRIAGKLVELGLKMGRTLGSNRETTFRNLKENAADKMAVLFPDLNDSDVEVTQDQIDLVEELFGSSYQEAKSLFVSVKSDLP